MIVTGDIVGIGQVMNDHWELKCKRSAEMSSPAIDAAYRTALDNGAIGGKLVGAGGGGFILTVASDDGAKLSDAMAKIGMPEVPFKFDHDGAMVMAL